VFWSIQKSRARIFVATFIQKIQKNNWKQDEIENGKN
jgi:hypothetical protein